MSDVEDVRSITDEWYEQAKTDIQGMWDQRLIGCVGTKTDIPDKPLYTLLVDLWDHLDRPPKPPVRVIPPNLHKLAIDDKLDQWGYLDERY